MPYDVFAMCNALFDLQVEVEDSVLRELGLEKGGMFLIDHDRQRAIVPRVYESLVNTAPGGSGANTAIGVAQFGGTACYTGQVGNDDHGRMYLEGLTSLGVKPNLVKGSGPTGISLILITPDAQRTMCTFLGESGGFKSSDLDMGDLAQSKYLYATAYLWETPNQRAAVYAAMEKARELGVKVALSLSDSFCIERHRLELLRVIGEYVDVLFGNSAEVALLVGGDTPQAVLANAAGLCKTVVVTHGAHGAVLFENGNRVDVEAFPVKAVDTTGAGDLFAAGVLYGLTNGLSLRAAGTVASYAASCVVAQLGPRLHSLDLNEVARVARTAA